MRSLLAVCLVLMCFVNESYGTLAEFFSNLPSVISDAGSYVWTSVTDAIKRPVQIKRLGKGGKLKSTSTTTMTPSALMEHEHQNDPMARAFAISEEKPTFRSANKLSLPLLTLPVFKTLEEWRDMQKPIFVDRPFPREPIVIVEEEPQTKIPSISYNVKGSWATLNL